MLRVARIKRILSKYSDNVHMGTIISVGSCSGECILETAEISAVRVSQKITKTVSRHAEVQISGRFGSNPGVFIPQRRETGQPIPIQIFRLTR
jgi:hypothetical protein